MKITGFDRLEKRLKSALIKAKAGKHHTVVGYMAPYAMAVHEKVEMKLKGQPRARPNKGFYWDPQGKGQAKFLEAPARRLKKVLVAQIAADLKRGLTLEMSIYRAGLRLLRESMALVPVDKGRLKSSGFVKIKK